MTTTNGAITAAGAAQFLSSPLPSSATITCTFANLSTDVMYVALDGLAAGPTHGFLVNAGETVDFSAIVAQLARFGALGQISVFGPITGAPFQIALQ
jgi:hypothetical protein